MWWTEGKWYPKYIQLKDEVGWYWAYITLHGCSGTRRKEPETAWHPPRGFINHSSLGHWEWTSWHPRACCTWHAASTWRWCLSSSSSVPFYVTNIAKWQSLHLNHLFFFLSLDYTVQTLNRQGPGKDRREPTKPQAVADSSFTKEESRISLKEIKSFQGSSYEYKVQVLRVSQSSTRIAIRDRSCATPCPFQKLQETLRFLRNVPKNQCVMHRRFSCLSRSSPYGAATLLSSSAF